MCYSYFEILRNILFTILCFEMKCQKKWDFYPWSTMYSSREALDIMMMMYRDKTSRKREMKATFTAIHSLNGFRSLW